MDDSLRPINVKDNNVGNTKTLFITKTLLC